MLCASAGTNAISTNTPNPGAIVRTPNTTHTSVINISNDASENPLAEAISTPPGESEIADRPVRRAAAISAPHSQHLSAPARTIALQTGHAAASAGESMCSLVDIGIELDYQPPNLSRIHHPATNARITNNTTIQRRYCV